MANYCTSYEVRMLAQVNYEQLGFSSDGDLEEFITLYLIPASDKKIDSYCNHSFGTPTIGTWTLDGSGKSALFMPTERCPLLGLSAGTVGNVAIAVSNIKVHDQYVDWEGSVFTKGKKNVTLAGSYGYVSLPSDIENASAMTCANILNDMVRKRVLPDFFQKEDVSMIMVSPVTFTKEIKESLEGYVLKDLDTG
jgi:hypothetical protein